MAQLQQFAPSSASSMIGRVCSTPTSYHEVMTANTRIGNAMVAAEPMEGANGFFVPALPIARVRGILAEHKLLVDPS